MDFEFKDRALLNQVFDKYAAFRKRLAKYMDAHEEMEKKLPIDPRDIPSVFVISFNFNMDMTDEEMAVNVDRFYDKMLHDPTALLNKLEKFQEDFNLENMDTTKEKDVEKILLFHSANQGFQVATAMNPDYKILRYGGTVEEMEKYDAMVMKSSKMNEKIYLQCLENDLTMNDIKHFPKGAGVMLAQAYKTADDKFTECNRKWMENFIFSMADYLSGNKKQIVFEVDEVWARIESIAKNVNTKHPDPVFGNERNYANPLKNLTGCLFYGASFTKKVSDSYHDHNNYQNVYVNGKSLRDLVPVPSKTDNLVPYLCKMTQIMAEAIRKGQPIDIVGTYMVNGKAVPKVYPMTFNYSKVAVKHYEDTEYPKHSSIRKTLFNWGPFRILPDYNKVNEKNAKSFASRSASILKSWNNTIKPLAVENYDKSIEKELDKINEARPERYRDFNPVFCKAPVCENVDDIFLKEDDSEDLLWADNNQKQANEPVNEIKINEDNLIK